MAGSLAELQDDQVPASGSLVAEKTLMHPQARQTLKEIHSLNRFEDYIRCARAELASDPSNAKLRAFIDMIEAMVREEKTKLVQVGQVAA